jgi:hypothetical protein
LERLERETKAEQQLKRERSEALVKMDDVYKLTKRTNKDISDLDAWGTAMDWFQAQTGDFPTEQELKAMKPAEVAGAYEEIKREREERVTRATGLRKEFAKASETFVDVRDSFARIQVAKVGTAAGDLALIFNFMKMLDPGSVVRESEFANAQNATGVPGRVRNLYNKLLTGERLNDAQRADFVQRAQDLFEAATVHQQQLTDEYGRLAKEHKIKPENVIVDYSYQGTSPTLPKGIEAGSTYAGKSKAGKDVWRNPDGELYEVD